MTLLTLIWLPLLAAPVVWLRLFEAEAPTHNRQFLERRIAYRMQEVEFRKVNAALLDRNKRRIATLLETGKVYEYTIDLWATSHMFMAGHCLRVEISSSNFPRFDRNLNTGGEQSTGTTFVTAEQRVLHDAAHRSHILLPIIT